MAFDQKHYVPILKAKGGEFRALKETAENVRKDLTPLLEIMDVPPKYLDGEIDPVPSKSDEVHIATVADNIAKAWGTDRRAFIDGFYVEDMEPLDEKEPIGVLLDELRRRKVKAVPVTGLDRLAEYNAAIKDAVIKDERGFCLRLQESDLQSEDLEKQLRTTLKYFGVASTKVDLLIDYGPVIPPRSTLVPLVNAIPDLKAWRTFTLSACSFPTDMSAVTQYSTVELPRDEWINWAHLLGREDRLVRMPTFSDYAINHPELSDVDPRKMRMSCNIRYTWNTSFVIAKGEAQPRKKDKEKKAPSKEQYPKLAQAIMEHPAWKDAGEGFSWGDDYIAKCANKECVGGGTEWRAVGTSHHLVFVVRQLANLP
jgi:hypothetical protein